MKQTKVNLQMTSLLVYWRCKTIKTYEKKQTMKEEREKEKYTDIELCIHATFGN